MKGVGNVKLKKVLFSISLVGISLLTMVATTFAWVGITSNSLFDEFSLNLRTDTEDRGDYGIQLSLSGIPGEFSDSIDGVSVRRQIMKNSGRYDNASLNNYGEGAINALFSQFEMDQCTPKLSSWHPNLFDSGDVQLFENVASGETTNFFMYFDVYATLHVVNSTADPSASTSNIPLFLREGILSSNEVGSFKLNNSYTYPDTPIMIDGLPYQSPFAGKTVKNTVRVNPASAARVCIQRFEPIDLYSGYSSATTGYTIYKYDDDIPYYDSTNDIYSFGGILPSEHNMAQQQFKLFRPDVAVQDVPEWQINRGDVKYEDRDDIGQVVFLEDGLTVGKKIKFRVYFWFEGWDADCFEVIDKRSVNVNLVFSSKGPNDI